MGLGRCACVHEPHTLIYGVFIQCRNSFLRWRFLWKIFRRYSSKTRLLHFLETSVLTRQMDLNFSFIWFNLTLKKTSKEQSLDIVRILVRLQAEMCSWWFFYLSYLLYKQVFFVSLECKLNNIYFHSVPSIFQLAFQTKVLVNFIQNKKCICCIIAYHKYSTQPSKTRPTLVLLGARAENVAPLKPTDHLFIFKSEVLDVESMPSIVPSFM